MTQKLQIFPLPQGKEGIGKGDLIKNSIGRFIISDNTTKGKAATWQPQYLYLCSNQKPKMPDWILDTRSNCIAQIKDDVIKAFHPDILKIEFTNNELCKLPSFPPELLQLYADAQGKMDSVEVETYDFHVPGGGFTIQLPTIINNACVLAKKDGNNYYSRGVIEGDGSIQPFHQPILNEQSDKELEEIARKYGMANMSFEIHAHPLSIAYIAGYKAHEQQSADREVAFAIYLGKNRYEDFIIPDDGTDKDGLWWRPNDMQGTPTAQLHEQFLLTLKNK